MADLISYGAPTPTYYDPYMSYDDDYDDVQSMEQSQAYGGQPPGTPAQPADPANPAQPATTGAPGPPPPSPDPNAAEAAQMADAHTSARVHRHDEQGNAETVGQSAGFIAGSVSDDIDGAELAAGLGGVGSLLDSEKKSKAEKETMKMLRLQRKQMEKDFFRDDVRQEATAVTGLAKVLATPFFGVL